VPNGVADAVPGGVVAPESVVLLEADVLVVDAPEVDAAATWPAPHPASEPATMTQQPSAAKARRRRRGSRQFCNMVSAPSVPEHRGGRARLRR
jgi:hypothetical protein